jgi:DNA-binding transcriptional LysR family regulator
MDFVNGVRTFLRVVEARSFSQAAIQLSTSSAAVTRQVAALEKHLEVRLLNRTTRKLSLTYSGEAFLAKARHLLDEIDDAENFACDKPKGVSGTLRLTAPLSFGLAQLAPVLSGFREKHPKLRLDVDLSDRVLDLAASGFDVALRITYELSPQLIARRIAPVPLVLCASPSYLLRRGAPRHPSELSEHDTLSYSYLAWGTTWPLMDSTKQTVNARIKPFVSATNGDVLRDLAVTGAGIILQPAFIVRRDLEQGRLMPILPEWKAPELNLFAVYLSHRQLSAKVGAFVDYLVESIGQDPQRGVIAATKAEQSGPSDHFAIGT